MRSRNWPVHSQAWAYLGEPTTNINEPKWQLVQFDRDRDFEFRIDLL